MTATPVRDQRKRLVIANRGEIARRVVRAGLARGYEVAVISTEDDADAPVRTEVHAVLTVPRFLDAEAIVAQSKAWGATHLHPGYGFLSENAAFAALVEGAGIAFVGPTPENMRAMGGKESAKRFAVTCGVPTLNALLSHELATVPKAQWLGLLEQRGIVPPYLVKASGGGGGRGMRIVEAFGDLPAAIARASEEAKASFDDGTVFVERYLSAPRHIEVQVFGDGHGGGVFLGERECSLQRRHQKVIEEAPSVAVDGKLREALGKASLALVKATNYRGAGTIEFLLDAQGRFHFLEMNTRLQVEHPVTEAVYGVDLVDAQLCLAEGVWPSQLGDPDVFHMRTPRGVSFEARLLAEDPHNAFLPTPGPIVRYLEPRGEGVRIDSGVSQPGRVNANYDSMIAKIIVHGADRAEAAHRLCRALEDTVVHGCTTNLTFLSAVARHPDFVTGSTSTAWIGDHLEALNASRLPRALGELITSAAFAERLAFALAGGPVDSAQNSSEAAHVFGRLGNGQLSVGSERETAPFTLTRVDGSEWESSPAAEPADGQWNAATGRFLLSGPRVRETLRAVPPEVALQLGPTLAEACARSQRGESIPLRIVATRIAAADIMVSLGGEVLRLACPRARTVFAGSAQGARLDRAVRAPMAGKVLEVLVTEGDAVDEGQVLFVVESMKMQLEVKCPVKGVVEQIAVVPGQILAGPDVMAQIG